METARVLVVEDDGTIGRGLSQALSGQGYLVRWAPTGADALQAVSEEPPDLVLLDLGLPDADGVEVCRRIRDAGPRATIVILTARSEEIDVVVGLDAGADDYLTKPFRLAELLARVRAHLRRSGPVSSSGRLRAGDLELDPAARRVWLGGNELDLRPKEFDLLALLVSCAGQAVTRERIMSEVWDEHWFGSTKTLDMHVSALRKKFGETGDGAGRFGGASRITTLRGVGYRLELP
jgi:DNA-binding response OmpR family regulator